MKAETNIYGPDGSLGRRGEEIPPGWFDELPDLHLHLGLDATPTSEPAEGEAAAEAADEGTVVHAKATVGRKRGSDS